MKITVTVLGSSEQICDGIPRLKALQHKISSPLNFLRGPDNDFGKNGNQQQAKEEQEESTMTRLILNKLFCFGQLLPIRGDNTKFYPVSLKIIGTFDFLH